MANPHASRLVRTRTAMAQTGVDVLLLGPGANLRWLTGYHALPLERLTLLIVPVEGEVALLVPALERARAAASRAGDVAEIVTWAETDDPYDAVRRHVSSARIAAVDDRLWASFTLQLQERLAVASWWLASSVLGPLRQRKDAAELAALAAAGAAIDEVHATVGSLLRGGRTEVEVGADIATAIRRTHDDVAFVIVASGPNGASPHHELGSRRLETGDAVVVDIGGVLDGYCSDSTRNYALGTPSDDYRAMHEVLEQAQEAGVNAVRPGVAAEDIDAAARRVLTAAGYGEHFVHRTGHGIGLEEHEEPWIVAGNAASVDVGMTFSVEPGVYVPGRHGARIEDIVAVTDEGVQRLNHRPHALTIV